MKTILLTLTLIVSAILATAQSSYPYKKLEARLKAEENNFKDAWLPIETLGLKYFDNESANLLNLDNQCNTENDSLKRELRELLINKKTELEESLKGLIAKVESIRDGMIKDNRFKDSAFKAQVRQLYHSEDLFEYTFTHVRWVDSVLLLQYKDSIDALKSIQYQIGNNIADLKKNSDFRKAYTLAKNSLSVINQRLYKIEQFFDTQTKKINDNRLVLYNAVEKDTKQRNELNEVNTVPALLSGLSEMNIIPTINVFAQRIVKKEGKGKVYGANLFLSSEQGAKDSATDVDFKRSAVYNILQPEASKFGFRMNYQRSFLISDINKTAENRVELLGSFNYLLKSLTSTSTDSINSSKSTAKSIGLIHVKGGGEWFFTEHFSCYATLNYIHIIQNSAIYQQYFLLKKEESFFTFMSLGINANLSFSGDQNNIKVGLDFIVNNGQIRKLNDNNDLLIPSLRFVYTPNLGKSF